MDRVYVVYQVDIDEWVAKTATTNKQQANEVIARLDGKLESVAIEVYVDGKLEECKFLQDDEDILEFTSRLS